MSFGRGAQLWNTVALEIEAQGELPFPHLRQIGQGEDLSTRGAIHASVRLPEIHVIEHVVAFSPELCFHSFRDRKTLGERHVGVDQFWSMQ